MYYKNFTIISAVRRAASFQVRPANQPTITGVALCHTNVGHPWSTQSAPVDLYRPRAHLSLENNADKPLIWSTPWCSFLLMNK